MNELGISIDYFPWIITEYFMDLTAFLVSLLLQSLQRYIYFCLV